MVLSQAIERRVQALISMRGYKVLSREDGDGESYLTVETRDGKKLLMWALETDETLSNEHVNRLSGRIEECGFDGGIIIGASRYAESARNEARKRGIELVSTDFPILNLFEHELVPKHEILTPEEREEVLRRYRIKPYQMPYIKASDPVARAIGAKPGDVLRIIRKSPTAGRYVSYRYVIEG
ncbi:DNA-directed RNA polymerase subunit H [Candidatus Bathyarchaeota archaeon]|nr:MAG: DNA-directed RNA polymerase subunit H [Candidatus Bathyarchaeota archaeon]